MKFKDILKEAVSARYSVKEAADILGIKLTNNFTLDDLKSAYRQLAYKHHPDKGGNPETFKEINEANEVLSKYLSGAGPRESIKQELRAEAEKKKDLIVKIVENSFNPIRYKEYFEKFTKKPIIITKDVKHFEYHSYSLSYQVTYDFKTDDDTIFHIVITANTDNATFDKSLGSGSSDSISIPIYTENYVFHNNLKQKMAKRDWKFRSSSNNVLDPSKMFPENILKKIFEGQKQRKFSKRDFTSGMTRLFDASFDGKEWLRIPLNKTTDKKEEIKISLYRSTFMGLAVWSINGIYKHLRREVQPKKYYSLPETEFVFESLGKLIKELIDAKEIEKMSIILEKRLKELKEALDKLPNGGYGS